MQPWIRVGIAGLLGGVAMFFWASVAHLATPLAATGIGALPREAAVLAPMQATLGDRSGFYVFPWMDGRGAEANRAYQAKRARLPSGLLVYHPPGTPMMETRQLIVEFAGEVLQCLIAASLLAWAAVRGYWLRVGFVTLLGAAAALATNLSYWNWYGFPGSYTLAYGGIEWAGYVAAGLVIGAILPRDIRNGLWRTTAPELPIRAPGMG